MTMILGINHGDFALLASDRRVMVHTKDGVHAEEGGGKVYETLSGGLLVGTGLELLVKSTASCFRKSPTPTLAKMERAILFAREACRPIREYSDIVREQFDVTRLFITAVMAGQTQVLIYAPEINPQKFAGTCPVGDVVLSAPAGAPDGYDRAWQHALRTLLRPLSEFDSVEASIAFHKALIRAFLWKISEHYPNVTLSGVVGVHPKQGKCSIEFFDAPTDDVVGNIVEQLEERIPAFV